MVESDDLLRALLGRKFENAGIDFVGFKDFSEDFIEQIVEMKPDLISLSMLYPGEKSGLDMLEILKKDSRTSGIPVFVLTNFTDKKYIEKAESLGIVQWLITAEHEPSDVIKIYSDYLERMKTLSHVFYFKCPCHLEFAVLSWKKDWNDKFTPFCPECGGQEVYLLENHDSEKQICQLKEVILESEYANKEAVTDYNEIKRVLSNITETQGSHYGDVMSKLEKIESKVFNTGAVDNRTVDELYGETEKIVREAGKASTSFIQRKLRIGYARAAQLIDMLEGNKVIETGNGAKPRKVLDYKEEVVN